MLFFFFLGRGGGRGGRWFCECRIDIELWQVHYLVFLDLKHVILKVYTKFSFLAVFSCHHWHRKGVACSLLWQLL